jgi:hypothetical protein
MQKPLGEVLANALTVSAAHNGDMTQYAAMRAEANASAAAQREQEQQERIDQRSRRTR